MNRTQVSSGAPWESVVGYSRAVRAGKHIAVTGTIGLDENGAVVAPGDGYQQAKRALEIIGAALTKLGAQFSDVIRTRIFVTDISQWEEVGRAHGEVFGEIRPATTMVEVGKLITDGAVVEIEADAIVAG